MESGRGNPVCGGWIPAAVLFHFGRDALEKGGMVCFDQLYSLGVLPVFWKQFSTVDAVYLLAVRIVMSMLFCAALTLVLRRGSALMQTLRDRRTRLRLAACGAAITVNWGLYIYAVSSNHILDGSLAYYIGPLLSILLGWAVFHERMTKLQWTAAAIALVSVLVPVVQAGKPPLLALCIGASFAVYGAMKKNLAVDSIVSLTVETLYVTPLALAYLIYAEITGGYLFPCALSSTEMLFLLLTGAATSVPLLFFAAGIHGVPISLSGMLLYINPTLQLLLGIFVYHEPFTTADAAVFVLVFIAVALFLIGGRRPAKPERKQPDAA